MAWRQGRLQNGDVSVFGSIKTLMSFSSVWYVCVVARHMMMVWQGSCQVRCVRRKSHIVTTKGFVAEKINSAGFCFTRTRGRCWIEVFRYLSQGKIRNNLLRNVLKEAECLSKSKEVECVSKN